MVSLKKWRLPAAGVLVLALAGTAFAKLAPVSFSHLANNPPRGVSLAAGEEPLPVSFDLRDEGRVTRIKKQGQLGTCWAFATMAACESNILTQNYSTKEQREAAFQDVLARLNELPQEELKGTRWSVPDKMDFVMHRVRTDGQLSFSSLFTERSPRGEVIVTFLALLELLRQHRVIIYQNAAFHEITILASKEEPDDKPLEKPDDYE